MRMRLRIWLWLTAAAVLLTLINFNFTATAKTILKPVDISITFTNNSLSEKNISWITKSSYSSKTVVKVWDDSNNVLTFVGSSKVVKGYLDYNSDNLLFNSEKNKTTFTAHKATLTGLKVDTVYFYQCGGGSPDGWSSVGSFTTGQDSGDFSFIYMTDPQSVSENDFAVWKRTCEHAVKSFPNAKFVVLAGDLVNRGCSENLWDKFFQFGKALTSRYTLVPAIGNHETFSETNTFSEHFNFPRNSNAKLPDYVYSFDYSNVHFMVLSTEMTFVQFETRQYGNIYTTNKEKNGAM